jgi:uncharacterized membrane protein YeaQ/YmgE (transglycosylase-associated protein family)
MSFVWMIIAGLICGSIAKVLMPARQISGLFILGLGGSIIAGALQYSQNRPPGMVAPFAGAIILLAFYACIPEHKAIAESDQDVEQDDFRKAA